MRCYRSQRIVGLPTLVAVMAGAQVAVVERAVNEVRFTDPDGDEIEFRIAGGGEGMVYSVNGEDKHVFGQIRYAPGMGVPGVAMPDIDKGFPIPSREAAHILGGLRHMAKKSHVVCRIDEYVTVPDAAVIGLPNDISDDVLRMRGGAP